VKQAVNGDFCSVSCKTGYEAQGNLKITCQDGQWTSLDANVCQLQEESGGGSNAGVIAGAVVGAVVGLAVLTAIGVYVYYHFHVGTGVEMV
jgi:hypothetical protein